MADPKIIASPLGGPFSEGGLTVDVQIYRLEDTKWSLEVVDSEGTSILLWDDNLTRMRPRKPCSIAALPRKGLSASRRFGTMR